MAWNQSQLELIIQIDYLFKLNWSETFNNKLPINSCSS